MSIQKIHRLNTLPKYYKNIISGSKNFEIRKNDRDFKVGDLIELHEFENNSYSGRSLLTEITYIFHGGEYGLEKGYCVLAIKPFLYKL